MDSSVLVKLYIREAGTDRMLALAGRQTGNQLIVLALAQVEVQSAFRRRQRAGEIDKSLSDQLLVAFHRHLEGKFLKQVLTDSILDVACELLDRHSLTSFDAIQLAGYFAVKTSAVGANPVFVSSDQELLAAARADRVPVLDPSFS